MVISLNGKSRRVRQWYRAHIYRMHNFRILFNQEQAMADPQEKKTIRSKMQHPQKKVEQHINYGIFLGIPEDEIMKFQSAIIQEVKREENPTPKAIIEALLEKDGQKQ